MKTLENPRKPWQEVHLAIWLKNSLFFEMSSQSGFCQLANNAGYALLSTGKPRYTIKESSPRSKHHAS
ncbi:hypothetical protein [Microcystis aeruginosa]|uniref:hypothetical protein n=1 Tax=Microcystis aeruginosa TaxID=1126 RepID=UPI001C202B2F|nr:hypothetical protein [Microcystis aeruginosa]